MSDFYKKLLFLKLFVLCICSISFSNINIKNYGTNCNNDGFFILKKSMIDKTNQGIVKTFEFEVLSSQKYYIGVFGNGLLNQALNIQVDGISTNVGNIVFTENGIQSRIIMDSKDQKQTLNIFLQKGTHQITFCSNDMVTAPQIEFIRLAPELNNAKIDDVESKNYINWLQTQQLPSGYVPPRSLTDTAAINQNERLASGSLTSTSVLAATNPLYDYAGVLNNQLSYTYQAIYYLTAGTVVTFETKKTDCWSIDPALYLFSGTNPSQHSWFNVNGAGCGYQSKITATITYSDYYMVLMSARQFVGTVDLYKDGQIVAANAPVAGRRCVIGSLNKTGIQNYFTCKPSSSNTDPLMWIMNSSNIIKAFNDDYSGSGDFSWSRDSRIKYDGQITSVLVSAYSSYNSGNYDVYMKCSNSDIYQAFPNLKQDDALQSSPASDNYNCISWSGGRTDLGRYFWPADQDCPNNVWYDSRGDKQSFNNFYGNVNAAGVSTPRFSGAITYIPTTDANLSVIDLWANPPIAPYNYTHGSVMKPSDNFYHGYDWESKPGGLTRTFHPRNALRGSAWNQYGDVVEYYKQQTGLMSLSAERSSPTDSKESGDTVLPLNKKELLNSLADGVSIDQKLTFNSLYMNWRMTLESKELKLVNNPELLFKSDEYRSLSSFCSLNKKETATLLMKKCLEGDELAGRIILKNKLVKNADEMMEKTKIESPHGKIKDDDSFTVDSFRSGWTRFVGNLLSQM